MAYSKATQLVSGADASRIGVSDRRPVVGGACRQTTIRTQPRLSPIVLASCFDGRAL